MPDEPGEYPFPFRWGQAIRVTGGKYNGFTGTVRWCGNFIASVQIEFEHKPHEIIEEVKFLQDLAEWRKGKSETELQLKS